VNATNDPALGWSGVRLEEAVDSLTRTTRWMLVSGRQERGRSVGRSNSLSAAVLPLRLAVVLLAQQALAALRLNADAGPPHRAGAFFFAENFFRPTRRRLNAPSSKAHWA
jgi:hypothetical protein